MQQFQAFPKKWGNSLGITIPTQIVEHEHLNSKKKIMVFVMDDQQKQLNNMFGTLKLKKPTQKVMREIDQGYDEH